jgi:membrane-bound lytic murein transglycosylase F
VGTARPIDALHTDDLPGIRRRGTLRVLTRNNASTYYVWRGELVGFEYELAKEFARRHGLRVEMVVPPSRADLFPWLLEGRGDLIAAGLTATESRGEREGVVFSRPYHRVREMVVARAGDAVERPEDLVGRRFVVRRGSHYWTTLERLREEGLDLVVEAAPEELETEQIVARVGQGEYDLTLADEHIARMEAAWRDDVRVAFALGPPVAHGWALRPSSRRLRQAVDAFFREEYRGRFMNVLADRYFESGEHIRRHAEARPARRERLTPWDETIRRFAAELGFDWRLIAAQMVQESRLDPQARSASGARGLMQVLPRTAESFGIEDLDDPERNIEAGVRYLAWTRDRFEPTLPADVRQWFALAAYNVGWGHVRDARRLAAQRGLDPDRWFGHVEQAILLKRREAVAAGTRFGWCRCGEPVRYVREIRRRYRAYVQAVAVGRAPAPPARLAARGPAAPAGVRR